MSTTPTRRRDIPLRFLASIDGPRTGVPSVGDWKSVPSDFGWPPVRAALNGCAHSRHGGDAESEAVELPASGRGGLPTRPPISGRRA